SQKIAVPPRLTGGLRNDFGLDALRSLLIGRELHAVVGPSLRQRPQIRGISEHLRERHLAGDHLRVAARFHALDPAAPRGDVAHDGAHVLFGGHDLDRHDRLHQHHPGALAGVLEGHRAGDLEGDFRRVDVVVAAPMEVDLDAGHRIAGQRAGFHRFVNPLVDRLDELLGDDTADDLVVEHVIGLGVRTDADLGVPELAAATGLPDVPPDALGLLGDRLFVGDLRLADVGADVELAHQPVDDDFEMQLAHA